ncbi:MAG: aspartate/glutamate racemase family protein [Actinobacteria bacterium]|nr:aspartate/glutamate racemase family protein [Actinomycetota bacterium]
MTQILVANVAATEEDSEMAHIFKTIAVDMWKRSFGPAMQPDTELTFRFPRRGLTDLETQPYNYFHTLGDSEILYMIMQAERDGFDGVVINCYHDPSLLAARQAVDIPVAGFGESSMLLALTMGRKFGLFCPSPLGVPDFEDRVAQYGLKDRCVGVLPGYLPSADQEAALVDAHAAIEEFTAVARELISRGAEVIIPGCGLIAPCVRFAPGCEAEYPNGITEIDGVPIMDLYGAAVKMVETLIALKRAGSPWISRKGVFARPSAKAFEGARTVLEYTGPGFWDCK